MSLSKAAFTKERAAADLVVDQLDMEPTHSVLHRSAAALAIACHQLRAAEPRSPAKISATIGSEVPARYRIKLVSYDIEASP